MRGFLRRQASFVLNRLLSSFRLVLDAVTDLAFQWLFGKRLRRSVPPVGNRMLMESATSLARKIRKRELSSESLVEYCIERINEVQPSLNAVVDDRFDAALKEAKMADRIVACLCDQALEALAVDAPFLGVPFSAKESIRVKGLLHAYGSTLRAAHRAAGDADAVKQLRKAGAIPLCVTNTSEAGTWWESSNCLYGTTNNPHDVRKNPGGSSGGEAALQCAAGVPLGLGVDTGGSIRTPASFCGIFGHKPTPGVVSVRGSDVVDPPDGHVSTMTCVGPMVRHADDLAPMLRAIAEKGMGEKLRLGEDVSLAKTRYFYYDGVVGGSMVSPPSPEVRQALMRVVRFLEDAYGVEVEPVTLPGMDGASGYFFAEAEADRYGPRLDRMMCGSLGVEWTRWCVGKSRHNFPFLVSASMDCAGDLAERLWPPRKGEGGFSPHVGIETLKNELRELLDDDGVLLCPTHPTVAQFHRQSYFKPLNPMYSAVFNVLGFPATTIPIGLSRNEGMPIGIQAVATPMNDRLTLALAKALERPFGGWIPPFSQETDLH